MKSAAILLAISSVLLNADLRAQTNTLVEARSRFSTKLLTQGPAPQAYKAQKPPAGAREISYQSGNLKLKAWITDSPEDGKKHPAVLFLHGGFAFDVEDWRMTAAFRKAGFVVMSPMVRGENGNPGSFEMFYGEVDDVIAALGHLKQQANVDPTKILIAGHSVGGTLAQLASMITSDAKAVASFSGAPDQRSFCNYQKEIVPFDMKRTEELRIRSPLSYPASVRTRLLLYAGEEEADFIVRENRALAKRASALGKPVTFKPIPGDHFSAVPAAVADTIREFQLMLREGQGNLPAK